MDLIRRSVSVGVMYYLRQENRGWRKQITLDVVHVGLSSGGQCEEDWNGEGGRTQSSEEAGPGEDGP